MPATPAFISVPPPDVSGWVSAFEQRELPVLDATAAFLAEMAQIEDTVDAHMLAPTLADDPLMALRLLRHVAALRPGQDGSQVETVTEALVMLGIAPLFRAFAAPLATVEQRLAGLPEALDGLRAVLSRAHRASRFALAFAIQRQDQDAAVIHQAALLHDFAELLLWLHAPQLAAAVAARLRHEPGLRSAQAQQEVLHVALADVQQRLMQRWKLPELLVRISDDQPNRLPQVRNVQLAIRVARHGAQGWHNPALPDDYAEIAQLLQLSPEHAATLVHETDAPD